MLLCKIYKIYEIWHKFISQFSQLDNFGSVRSQFLQITLHHNKVTIMKPLAYVSTLPFWMDSSRPPVSSWNLPFWNYPGLNLRSSWILQVDHNFYKLDIKILAASNKIRSVHCPTLLSHEQYRSVSTKVRIVLAQAKEAPGPSFRINAIRNF